MILEKNISINSLRPILNLIKEEMKERANFLYEKIDDLNLHVNFIDKID